MTEKRTHNSKLNGKGLDASVTEEMARQMAENQGSRYLLLVEVHSGRKVVDEDGTETVQLVPDLVEVVPDEHAVQVRGLLNALVAQRPEQAGQLALQGQEAPDVASAAAGVWDGDPDAPVGPEFDGQDEADDGSAGNVVEFSGKA